MELAEGLAKAWEIAQSGVQMAQQKQKQKRQYDKSAKSV